MPSRRRGTSRGVRMVLSPSKGVRSVMAASLCRGRTGIQPERGAGTGYQGRDQTGSAAGSAPASAAASRANCRFIPLTRAR